MKSNLSFRGITLKELMYIKLSKLINDLKIDLAEPFPNKQQLNYILKFMCITGVLNLE